MATQKVGTAAPQRMTDYKRVKLCVDYSRLDAERLDFDRQSRARSEAMKAIAAQLEQQLKLDGVSLVDLPRWQFGTELTDGGLFYMQELIKEIGFDEFERRKAAAPPREKFFLRDKGTPARATRGKTRVTRKRPAA